MTAPVTRLGVAGWPVAHSLSPVMQNAALAARGLAGSWHYQLLPIPPELFAETVPALAASGFRGINVTIPHKQAALTLATERTTRADAMGAANTLVFGSGGAIHADNTDGPGMIAALSAAFPDGVGGRSAAVLGAGGTARSAVWALLHAGARTVRVWNRTQARADELCARVGGDPLHGASERCETPPELAAAADALMGSDIIVNCTAVGLRDGDAIDQLPLSDTLLGSASVVVDFVYRPRGTVVGHAAERLGIPLIDGLELLVQQGADAFTQFTGRAAPLEVMRAALHR